MLVIVPNLLSLFFRTFSDCIEAQLALKSYVLLILRILSYPFSAITAYNLLLLLLTKFLEKKCAFTNQPDVNRIF